MIQSEYESLKRKESGELVLKATNQQFRNERRGNYKQRDGEAQKFNGKCFGCERIHGISVCPQNRQRARQKLSSEHAFMALDNKYDMNWLLDVVPAVT